MSNSDDSSAGTRRRARPVRLLTAAVFALAGLGTVPLLAVNTVLLGIYGLFVYRSLKTKMI